MTTPRGDVDAALAGLQARWGAAAPRVVGALALAPLRPRRRTSATLRARPRRARHPHRLRRARRDPRTGRPPEVGQRRDPRRRLERPDDARPAGRRRGPGAGLGRRLARPVAQLRPGRGRRPRHPARVARRHHPGQPRRGAVASRARCSPAGRSTCSSSTCPAVDWPGPTSRRRIADRLHRLAALARRAETLLLILDAPGRGSAAASRPRSTSRPGSGSSWPAGRGSAWAATSSASAPRRSSPTTATARRGAGRRSGSSTPRAASGTRVSPGTPC